VVVVLVVIGVILYLLVRFVMQILFYADGIVLLAPCASALRTMLDICSSYAVSHGLEFNANKTQLICFHTPSI
jgi:hypothetical protein